MSLTPRKTVRSASDKPTVSSPRKIPRLEQASGTIVPRKSPARRRLFVAEDEMDTGEGDLFVQRLLDELAEEQKLKWGFDFERGEPLANSNFIYHRVSAEQVPGFYRCFSMGAGVGELSAPSTIPSDWVYPGAAQAHNERIDGEDTENVNPQLLRLEDLEESFANDTTSSSSVSFTSTLSPTSKGNTTAALGCIESSTSVIKESGELSPAYSPSKRIFKTPTSRKPSRISDALPNRKHLQRSAKKLELTSPKSPRKSVAPCSVTSSPTTKRATVARRRSPLTVGSRLAAAGHSRCSEMEK